MENNSGKQTQVKEQGNIVDLAMQMFAGGIEKNVAEIALKNMQYDKAVINDVLEKVWGKNDHFRKYYNQRIQQFGSFNEKLRDTLQKDSNLFAAKALETLGFLEGLYPMSKIENNSLLLYEAAPQFAARLMEYSQSVEVVNDYIQEVRKLITSDIYAVEAMRVMAGCRKYANSPLYSEFVERLCSEIEDNIGRNDDERKPLDKILEGYGQLPIVKKYLEKINPAPVECSRKPMDRYVLPVMVKENGDILFGIKDKLYVLEKANEFIHETQLKYHEPSSNRTIRFGTVLEGIGMFKNEGTRLSYYNNVITVGVNGMFSINEAEYSDLSGYVLSEAVRRASLLSDVKFDVRRMSEFIENRMFIKDISDVCKTEMFANDVNSNVAIFLEGKYNRNRYCVFYVSEGKSVLKDYKDLNEAVSDMSKWTSLDVKTMMRERLIDYNSKSVTNEMKKMIYDHDLEILENLMKVTSGLNPKDKGQKQKLDEVRALIADYTNKIREKKENI